MHIFYSELEIISTSPYVFYVSLCGNVKKTQTGIRIIATTFFSSLESQTNFYLIL